MFYILVYCNILGSLEQI